MRVLAVMLVLSACGEKAERCDPEALLALAAPAGAMDCGVAARGEDAAVSACLVAAFEGGGAAIGLVTEPAPRGLVTRGWIVEGAEVSLQFGSFDACNDVDCRGAVDAHDCTGTPEAGSDGIRRLTCGVETCGERICGVESTCEPAS